MSSRNASAAYTVIGAALTLALVYSGQARAVDVVELEVSATQPEYMAQDRAIWDLYEEENPNVKIKLFPINEDTEAAYQARVAAGDPADIRGLLFPTQDNYKTYMNLLEVDFPWWDRLTYDAKTIFEKTFGVKGYAPAVNVRAGLFFSFIYYADEMDKAGLDPKKSVKTVDDLRDLLEKLKAYVETRDDLEYVLDTGWHPRAWGRWMVEAWGVGLGASKQEMIDLFTGKIEWTDEAKNPLVPVFKLMKEFTDKGYFPAKWWTRGWEQEYESSFIGRKSILTYHGPWMWNKTLAQQPDARLEGFFFPANQDGILWQNCTTADRGSALYVANMDKADFEEAKKALYWWTSPEIVKLRAEAIGFLPAYDLSDVGGVELDNPQYNMVIKPALDGAFGDVRFDDSLCGQAAAGPMKKSGTPYVMEDNAVAPLFGEYMSGAISLGQVLEKLQGRWENAYGS